MSNTVSDHAAEANDLSDLLLELDSMLDRTADGIEKAMAEGVDTSDCATRIMRNVARQLGDCSKRAAKLRDVLSPAT